ncbi:MAG TPA: alanine dehydrogenase [Actinomycetaceae bacterium]|nr:alanine dehydrogenase [Actinomycetaceae bacterium]
MRIGVPTEVKDNEYRVAITPAGVHELVAHGHEVIIQSGAGEGSAISDEEYTRQGAHLAPDAETTWGEAELVLKVKEPVAQEYGFLRADLTLFGYLHLAADRPCTEALLNSGVTAIAYETVRLESGQLPLLYPMSEVAGCLAPQIGSRFLTRHHGGRGVILGGVAGVASGDVLVLGAGVAGQNAANIASGMGARVTILDTDSQKLREVGWRWQGRVQGIMSSRLAIRQLITEADLVIGSVLIPGARAPRLVTNDMVADMKPGSVLVDIAIDQGGCFEDSRPTTHSDPVFRVHQSLFYCVANMPGAVPHSSTYALTNATLPYVLRIANASWQHALRADPALAEGLNTFGGSVTHPGVAQALDLPLLPVEAVLIP